MSDRQKQETAIQSRQPSERDLLQALITTIAQSNQELRIYFQRNTKTLEFLNQRLDQTLEDTGETAPPHQASLKFPGNPFKSIIEELTQSLRFEQCNETLFPYLVELGFTSEWSQMVLHYQQYQTIIELEEIKPVEKRVIKHILQDYKLLP